MVAEKNNFDFPEPKNIKIYFIPLNEQAKRVSLTIINNLRSNGISCEIDMLNRSMKSQMRDANKLNAEYVYIIGDAELSNKKGILKKMTDGTQAEVAFDDLYKTAVTFNN